MSYKLQSPKPRRDEIEKQVKREKKKITQREHLSIFFFPFNLGKRIIHGPGYQIALEKEKVTKELQD